MSGTPRAFFPNLTALPIPLHTMPRPPRGPGDAEDDEMPEGDPPDDDPTDDPSDEDEGEADEPPMYGSAVG